MLRNLFFTMALTATSLSVSTAFAGECILNVTREACPGKEKESYEKCKGQKSCNENKKTGSAEACAKEAVKACQNKRLDQTKSKVIKAKFAGAELEGGKDFCAAKVDGVFDPATDFNHCK